MELNIMLVARGFFVAGWEKIAVTLKRKSLEKLVKILIAIKLNNYHINKIELPQPLDRLLFSIR
tara:strand:+ start:593 stop:784 length:192 start_codon:yes stop_codon:yes gene_type:complete